jgi:integrase
VKRKLKTKRTPSQTNPIKETVKTIKGYPEKLIYFKIAQSKNYYARVFQNGRYTYRSLRTQDVREAKKLTIQFYEEVLTHKIVIKDGTKPRGFTQLAHKLIESFKEDTPRVYKDDKSRLANGIISFFQDRDISEITHQDLQQFYQILLRRKLKPQTITHYFLVIRKVFKFAVDLRVLKEIPSTPRIKNKSQNTSRRSYLTQEDYKTLTKAVDKLTKEQAKHQSVPITEELKYLIQFSINSFIRPTDLKVLQNKHVTFEKQKDPSVDKRYQEYLVLNHPATKTTDQPVVTMPAASAVYKKQLEVTKKNGFGQPDDYIFYPQYKNRNYFLNSISRIFKFAIKEAGLENSNKEFTLYSLRHTSIIYRILKGENIDLITLAKNARTSVAMIEQYYTRDLSTVLSAPKIHSFKAN